MQSLSVRINFRAAHSLAQPCQHLQSIYTTALHQLYGWDNTEITSTIQLAYSNPVLDMGAKERDYPQSLSYCQSRQPDCKQDDKTHSHTTYVGYSTSWCCPAIFLLTERLKSIPSSQQFQTIDVQFQLVLSPSTSNLDSLVQWWWYDCWNAQAQDPYHPCQVPCSGCLVFQYKLGFWDDFLHLLWRQSCDHMYVNPWGSAENLEI